MKNTMLAILFLCSFSLYAQDRGGVFLEPILSYEQTDFNVDYPSPLGGTDGEITGIGIGGRLGFHVYESLFVALDARYLSHEFNDGDNDFNSDADGYNYGPVIGIQLPTTISARLWAGYVMGGELDPDSSNSFDVKYEDASGYRIGVGFMVASFSLNLEYQNITYDTSTLESAGPFTGGTSFSSVEMENSGYVASVSFPFAL